MSSEKHPGMSIWQVDQAISSALPDAFNAVAKERDALLTENQSLRTQLAEKEAEAAVMREALEDAARRFRRMFARTTDELNNIPTPFDHAIESTSAGKAYQERMEEARWLLAHCPNCMDPNQAVLKEWWKRRETLLEQLKGGV